MSQSSVRQVRVTCPHNCYDTCSMLATVTGGVLTGLEGDPAHPHTRGRLCAKGYSYIDRVYAPDRLRHPMVQSPRGSGNWRRVTWDEALELIATRLLAIHHRHGSLLPVCLYRASGNLGELHKAPEAFFHALGPYTRAENTLCWAAGTRAQEYDFGAMRASDPATMVEARTLLLWGVNPAWTAPHQMNRVIEAQDRGARVIAIDPIVTATATQADLHLQPRPGSDGALALGMAWYILDEGLCDQSFLASHVEGWPAFARYLRDEVSLSWAAAETGLAAEAIADLARRYATETPSMIWVGFGLQRHANATQTVRALDALAAMTGQIGRPGAGVQFAQTTHWQLHEPLYKHRRPAPAGAGEDRVIDMGAIGHTLPALTAPPVELLWITQANPVCQEPDSQAVRRMLAAMEMVVVVDQFRTRTAELADILLPATTFLEGWDLHVSYWHPYASITQQAIAPLYEARSDLQIAWMLAQKLNQLAPGFCPFPTGGDERAWAELLWQQAPAGLFGGAPFEQLLRGPVRAAIPAAAWSDGRFATPSGHVELWSEQAARNGKPALPTYEPAPAPPERYPYRLLTPHPAESLHSQFHDQRWAPRVSRQPVVEMHPDLAGALNVREGDVVRVHNEQGEMHLPVRLTRTVPPDTLVAYEASYQHLAYNVNELTRVYPGHTTAYADCFVAAEASRGRGRP